MQSTLKGVCICLKIVLEIRNFNSVIIAYVNFSIGNY